MIATMTIGTSRARSGVLIHSTSPADRRLRLRLRFALATARLVRGRGRDALGDLRGTATRQLAFLDLLVLTLSLGTLDSAWWHSSDLLWPDGVLDHPNQQVTRP